MFFSKSFGYAIRGILYVVLMNKNGRRVQIGEIAAQLTIPRHFLGKIMKTVVKEGILTSTKGPFGGFSINEVTLSTRIITLVRLIDGGKIFNHCVLHFRDCGTSNPCPLHYEIDTLRKNLTKLLTVTTIKDLAEGKESHVIRSIAAA